IRHGIGLFPVPGNSTPMTRVPNVPKVRRTARLAAVALVAATFAGAGIAVALLTIEAAAPAFAQKRKSVPQASPELPTESSGDVGESGDLGNASDAGDGGEVVDPEGEGMVDAPADAPPPDDLDVGSGDGPIDPGSSGV